MGNGYTHAQHPEQKPPNPTMMLSNYHVTGCELWSMTRSPPTFCAASGLESHAPKRFYSSHPRQLGQRKQPRSAPRNRGSPDAPKAASKPRVPSECPPPASKTERVMARGPAHSPGAINTSAGLPGAAGAHSLSKAAAPPARSLPFGVDIIRPNLESKINVLFALQPNRCLQFK